MPFWEAALVEVAIVFKVLLVQLSCGEPLQLAAEHVLFECRVLVKSYKARPALVWFVEIHVVDVPI